MRLAILMAMASLIADGISFHAWAADVLVCHIFPVTSPQQSCGAPAGITESATIAVIAGVKAR